MTALDSIRDLHAQVEAAKSALRDGVVQALTEGVPVRDLVEAAGVSTATITRIKREAGLVASRTYTYRRPDQPAE